MKRVSESVKRRIKRDNRVYKARVIFSFLAWKTPEAVVIKAPNAVVGSVVDSIAFPYVSHIAERFFIDHPFKGQPPLLHVDNRLFPNIINRYKSGHFTRVRREKATHIGYIGRRADSAGNVADEIEERFPRARIEKITLRTNADRIITDGRIEVYTNNKRYLPPAFVYEIKGNSSPLLEIPCRLDGVTHLRLIVTKATADKHIWVVSFFAGFEFCMDEGDIVKFRHKLKKSENKGGTVGRLYLSSIDMTVSNLSRRFDSENVRSVIAFYMDSGSAFFSVELCMEGESANEAPFKIDLGTFVLSEFTYTLKDATAAIKGEDFIGAKKDETVNLGIVENKSAYDIYASLAAALNLSPLLIDESLKKVMYTLSPFNGTALKLLNKVASETNSFCMSRGKYLVATLVRGKRAGLRYPLRYFHTDEYKEGRGGGRRETAPNVVNLTYSEWGYEEGEFVARKEELFYNRSIKQQKNKWGALSLADYVNGVYVPAASEGEAEAALNEAKPVSWQKTYYNLPAHFDRVEVSDSFVYRVFEWCVNYIRDGATQKIIGVHVKIYSYAKHDDTEQATIMFLVRQKPKAHVVNSQNYIIYPHHADYTRSALLSAPIKDAMSAEEMEARNAPNEGEKFSLEIDAGVSLERVEIANYLMKGLFEFYYRLEGSYITVKVWNYMEVPQTLTVNLYGVRLKAGEKKTRISARDEESVRVNGEIVKNMSVEGVGDKESALRILHDALRHYRNFSSAVSVKLWSDPRLELYDYIACRKLRYAAYTQGIIDEITLDYNGALSQEVSLVRTKAHNRDCRMYGGFALGDRPANEWHTEG